MSLKFQEQFNYSNFYRTKEPSNIWEDDLSGNSIIKTLNFEERCPGNSTKKFPKFQNYQYDDSYKVFLLCCDDIFTSPLSPKNLFKFGKRRRYPKKERVAHTFNQFARRSSSC
jgi:hypothetical protein